jgi:hypothetical protein
MGTYNLEAGDTPMQMMEPWTDVTEGMPERHKLVLLTCVVKAGDMSGRMIHALGMWGGHPRIAYCEDMWLVDSVQPVHVVGWMPIPPVVEFGRHDTAL